MRVEAYISVSPYWVSRPDPYDPDKEKFVEGFECQVRCGSFEASKRSVDLSEGALRKVIAESLSDIPGVLSANRQGLIDALTEDQLRAVTKDRVMPPIEPGQAPLRLPNWSNTPNGGWDYRIPEISGDQAYVGHFTDYESLFHAVQARYKANGLEVPSDIKLRVEQYICARLPEYCGAYNPAYASSASSGAFTFANVMNGTKTLLEWMIGGAKKVAPELAETRAKTCAKCPMNMDPHGCNGCNQNTLQRMADRVVNGGRTKYDDQLKACEVCGCSTRAKIHLPADLLLKNMPARQIERLPDHCWLIKERPLPPL